MLTVWLRYQLEPYKLYLKDKVGEGEIYQVLTADIDAFTAQIAKLVIFPNKINDYLDHWG